MIDAGCHSIFFCPFKAEAVLLADNLGDCRKINAQTWSAGQTMIFTWNGAGFLPMQKFLDCFAVSELKTRALTLFGSAGAVDDQLHPGQIFAIDQVKCGEKNFELKPTPGLPRATALTKDTPVLSTILRQNIFEKHGSCLIDQESSHFIEYFQRYEIEVRVIRFVSDTPSFPFKLPFPRSLNSRFAADWAARF